MKTLFDSYKISGSSNKPVAAVCHAPAALLNVKDENGDPLVKGKKVTGFTNTEEEGVKLTDVVPLSAGR